MINALIEIQKQLGANDTVFAKRLGIARPLWISIKNGWSKPGAKSLPAILKAFPELKMHI